MEEGARRTYRAIAWAFLGIGGVVLLVALFERILRFDFFTGDPTRVALFVMAIGGALLWTARERGEE